MDLLPQYATDPPPHLPIWNLPEKEQGKASSLVTNLRAMRSFANEFANTVGLFDQVMAMDHFAEKRGQRLTVTMDWAAIVARAGAISLYNFGKALEGAEKIRHRIDQWHPLVDHKIVEEGKAMFHTAFPGTRQMRQAIMHTSEMFWNEERHANNKMRDKLEIMGLISSPPGFALTHSAMLDNRYYLPFNGELYSYELSSSSIVSLKRVAEYFFSAFTRVARTA